MSNLSDIKRRLASVKQTRQITGAMETVSVSKMRKAADKLAKSREYMRVLETVIHDISDDDISGTEEKRNGANAVVVFSTDKGLCGAFDHDIFKFADGVIGDGDTVFPVGSIAAEHYKKRNAVDMRFSDKYSSDENTANEIAKQLYKIYEDGAKSISLIYSEPSGGSQHPVFKKLLPFNTDDVDKNENKRVDCFEPSKAEVKKTLIPLYMSGEVYGALVNHSASEHSARRAAMSAATESADEMIAKLSAEYNRARQATVTEQIVEIIGSTEALNKR